jgi:hypothetical protein
MTPLNMAKHRNSPHMAFWRMIKEGNDHFEVTKAEPHVDVCEKRYVFDARAPANASTPIAFHGREKCPVYEVPEEIATAVKAKQSSDERAFTDHVNRGVATVAIKTGTDGGMHPVFLAKLQSKSLFDLQSMSSDVKAPPGPLPATVNPPRTPEPEMTAAVAAPASSRTAQLSESSLKKLGKWFGFGGSEPAGPAMPAATSTAAKPKPAPTQTAAAPAGAAPKPAAIYLAPAGKPQPKSQTEVAQASPQGASQASLPQQAGSQQQAAPSPPPAASPGLMAGASPVVPSGTFEGRWGAIR